MTMVKRIGILTAGGDCPGLNAVIRGVSKSAMSRYGMEVIGIMDGFSGLMKRNARKLTGRDVSGILTLGGTILGSSNKDNPFDQARYVRGKLIHEDVSDHVVRNYNSLGLDALVCLGGDGTLAVSSKLMKKGLNIVNVPKTIDNDVSETDLTFGFDTAVANATDAIDKVHTTAMSHHRVLIVETMGRYAGWLALTSGIAGGGDIILIPEIPYDLEKVCSKVVERSKKGKRFSIIVVSEGACPKGGCMVIRDIVEDSPEKIRLGGVSQKLAKDIEALTRIESRAMILGHLQRGGSPTAFDRVLATRFGTKATELVAEEKFGYMVALKGKDVKEALIEKAASKLRLVTPDHPLIKSAEAVGTCLGY